MVMVEVVAVAALALVIGAALAFWLTRMRLSTQIQIAEERSSTRELRIRELGEEVQALHERHDQQLHGKDQEISLLQLQTRELDNKLATAETRLTEERKLWEQKLSLLNEAREQLGNAFKALAAEALKSSNQSFLELAKSTLSAYQAEARGDMEQRQQAVQSLVTPIQQSLNKVQEQIQLVEQTRAQVFGSLTEQLSQVVQAQDRLRNETGNLVKALRAPQARGRWGEIQLKRVVEMAGMVEHCDFEQQASVNTEDGKLRPDMVVRLPGGKNIVVDAKVPLAAYLEALEATDDAGRIKKLDEHALQVRAHLAKLGNKQYWQQFQPAPEFVVLFLPGESFFSAALQQDPTLIEEGVNQQVIIATPTTLIALLRAVAYGWRQEAVAEHAQKVGALGQELYDRIRAFAYHLVRVGNGLDSAVESYNKAVGSLETRVLVSARRFREMGSAAGQELPEPEQLQKATRALQAGELVAAALQAPALAEVRADAAALELRMAPVAEEPAPAAPLGADTDATVEAAVAESATAPPAPVAEDVQAASDDPFPSLEEVLATPTGQTPSLEEIMAVVGESPPAANSPG